MIDEMVAKGVPPSEILYRSIILCCGQHHKPGAGGGWVGGVGAGRGGAGRG